MRANKLLGRSQVPRLRLLPYGRYRYVDQSDPVLFYYWPIVGTMYRRRVELCLAELRGGDRILEVGFGSGTAFLNLHDSYREIYGLDLTAPVAEVTSLFSSIGIDTVLQNGNVLGMPYPDGFFDAVLLISILEHLKVDELEPAFMEVRRVLKSGGQVVYGVPVERPLMVLAFWLLGHSIHEHHHSTERDVSAAAESVLGRVGLTQMPAVLPGLGSVYQIGHFVRQ